ncbi:hypothetical protein PIROE2DRAFT_2871 [Piromyces sp. E2]|nr:hypothetical protein PIROE2DRAFT_2871 [Piromyces sp. E2]|eukprot:OUM69177.1 hypothetical protein PIROE2DRAFT_2871 [Piromyces sp. E2]
MENRYKHNNSMFEGEIPSNYYKSSDSENIYVNHFINENNRKNNSIYMGKYRYYNKNNNYNGNIDDYGKQEFDLDGYKTTNLLNKGSKISKTKKFNVFLVDNDNEEPVKPKKINKPRVRFSFDDDIKPKYILNNNNSDNNFDKNNNIKSSSRSSFNYEHIKKPRIDNNDNSEYQKRFYSSNSSSSSYSSNYNDDNSLIKYNNYSRNLQNYYVNSDNKTKHYWNDSNKLEYNSSNSSESSIEIPHKNYRIAFENSMPSIENSNLKNSTKTINIKTENQKTYKNENIIKNYYYYDSNSTSSESSLSESSIETSNSSDNSKSQHNSMISFSTESGSLIRLEKSLNYKFPRFSRFNELKRKYGIDKKNDVKENESHSSVSVEGDILNQFNSNELYYNQYGYLHNNMDYYTENQVYSDVSSNKLPSTVYPFDNINKVDKVIYNDNDKNINELNHSYYKFDPVNNNYYDVKTNNYFYHRDKPENQLSIIPNNYYNNNNYYYGSSDNIEGNDVYQYQISDKDLPKSFNKTNNINDVKEIKNKNKLKTKNTAIINNNKEYKNTGSTLPFSFNETSNNNESEETYSKGHTELIKIAKYENEYESSSSSSSFSSSFSSYYDSSNKHYVKEKQSIHHKIEDNKISRCHLNPKNKVSNKNVINRKNGYCISNNNEFFINTDNGKAKNKKGFDKKLFKLIKRYINENNYGNSDIVLIIVNDKMLNDNVTFSSSSSSYSESSYVKRESETKKRKNHDGNDDVNNNISSNKEPEGNTKLYSMKVSIENQSVHHEIDSKVESMGKENESKPSFIVNSITIPSFIGMTGENQKMTPIIEEIPKNTLILEKKSNEELTSSIICKENNTEKSSISSSDESIKIIPREVNDFPDELLKTRSIMVDKEVQVSIDELNSVEIERPESNSVLSINSNPTIKSSIESEKSKSSLPELEKEKLSSSLPLKDEDVTGIVSAPSTEIIIDEDNEYFNDEIISESDSINMSKSTVSDYKNDLSEEIQKKERIYPTSSFTKESVSLESTEATRVNSTTDVNFNDGKDGYHNKLNTIEEVITESPPETIIEDYQISTSIPQELPLKKSIPTLVNKPLSVDNVNVVSSDNITINNTTIYNDSMTSDSTKPVITTEITLNSGIDVLKLKKPVDTTRSFITPPPSPLHIDKENIGKNGNEMIESSPMTPLFREPDIVKASKDISKVEPVTPDATTNNDSKEGQMVLPRTLLPRSKSPYMDNIKVNPIPRINIFPYGHRRSSSGQESDRSNKRRIDISKFISSIRNREESLKAKENEFLKVIDEETEKNKVQKSMIQKTSNELNDKIKEVRQLTREVSNHKKILMKQKEKNDQLQEELEEEKKQAQNLQQQLDSQCELNSKQEKEISYYKEIHNMYLEENQRLQALLLKLTNAKSMMTSPSIPSLSLPPPSSPTSINSPPKNPIISPASSANTLI